MKLLLGMLRPEVGTAWLLGEPVLAGPAVWSGVGHLLETPFGYGELTPTKNWSRLQGMDGTAVPRVGVRAGPSAAGADSG